jgi:hypothetical protein
VEVRVLKHKEMNGLNKLVSFKTIVKNNYKLNLLILILLISKDKRLNKKKKKQKKMFK